MGDDIPCTCGPCEATVHEYEPIPEDAWLDGYADGLTVERARIVAWLYTRSADTKSRYYFSSDRVAQADGLEKAANGIARGDHIPA